MRAEYCSGNNEHYVKLIQAEGDGERGRERERHTHTHTNTHPQSLSESQVREKNVCLLNIADFTFHFFVHLLGVESDSATGQRSVASQSVE